MYWAKILTAHESKLTNIIHFYFYKCYTEESFVHQWIKCVGHILNSCELSYVWINEKKNRSVNWFKSLIKENLKNQFVQDWNSVVHYSPKCINYRILKINVGLEYYLLSLLRDLGIVFAKIMTCNHRLPVGPRWINIDRKKRICT